ncbi:hypothetical protein HK405_003436 [Cladochytrium tenue]|nr:hypothetical protein HK405_003436 [Cladochytrium tenue]
MAPLVRQMASSTLRFLRSPTLASKATWAFQGICITLLCQRYLFDITMCSGPSMLPTFNTIGDVVFVEYFTWRWLRSVSLGDVVVAVSPISPDRAICKRVLGMPGDTVLRDPTLSTTDFIVVRTAALVALCFLCFEGLTKPYVPPGHVWLQGDNMSNSTDSRVYGPVPMGLLRGRVRARLFPSFNIVR